MIRAKSRPVNWDGFTLIKLLLVIRSAWQQVGGNFRWQVTVPPNTTAHICVPTHDSAIVMETGRSANSTPGMKFLCQEYGRTLFKLHSGQHEFVHH